MSGTDYTLTTNLGLYKPVANADINAWGAHLNNNADMLDGAVHGLQAGAPYLPLSGWAAAGTPTTRTPQDRAADHVHAKDFGAVFDGNSHPLSAYYTTLAAAQAVYPKATALTNEIDGIAIQAAIDFCAARSGSTHEYSFGGTVVIPQALGLMNTPLTITNSCVSLESLGHGIGGRRNVTYSLTSPAKLRWTGPAVTTGNAAIYMMTVRVADAGRALGGCNIKGVLFDCNQTVGVGGILIRSLVDSLIDVGVYEPRGVPYAATLVAGSRLITVASTANIGVGQSVVSASLPNGLYVASIVSGTTFNASGQATASSSETLCVGGEGMRLDVEDNIADANDTQGNEVWFSGSSEQAAAYTAGPLVMLGGSCVHGSGPGPTFHFGNTSINVFHLIRAISAHCALLVVNYSDHNIFDRVDIFNVGGGASCEVLLNGSLDANNGVPAFNYFHYITGGKVRAVGTDTAGFTQPSFLNQVAIADIANGGGIAGVGTGATLSMSGDSPITLRSFYNNNAGIIPYLPDNTAMGGNGRGAFSVDLQTNRSAAAQVASGADAVIAGGQGNTASGNWSTVPGGVGNIASGQSAIVLGGNGNTASGANSVAMGTGAVADLFGCVAQSSGWIGGGQRLAQFVRQVLIGTSAANTTPVRLTADGAAAGATNVCNMTALSSVQANNIHVQLVAIDSTTGNNRYAWTQNGLLLRDGAPASSGYVPGTPTVLISGTTTGIAITEAADTVNGAYSLTFTPPTGNTSVWRVVATVEWTRVDGS